MEGTSMLDDNIAFALMARKPSDLLCFCSTSFFHFFSHLLMAKELSTLHTAEAWNASSLSPRPPLEVVLPYFLPYASYHEASHMAMNPPLQHDIGFNVLSKYLNQRKKAKEPIGDRLSLPSSFVWFLV